MQASSLSERVNRKVLIVVSGLWNIRKSGVDRLSELLHNRKLFRVSAQSRKDIKLGFSGVTVGGYTVVHHYG